ncbi:hypothetical protein HZA86_03720 [Candidatus Uhrbacteria bacterium]|nr:hypothetical protein [Candidatus Uhrbacteria bacterium]
MHDHWRNLAVGIIVLFALWSAPIGHSATPKNTVPSMLPDLRIRFVTVSNEEASIVVENTGGVASKSTDVWLMWFAGSRALSSSAAVPLPVIPGLTQSIVAIPLEGSAEASKILREPPKGGTRVRLYLDGSRTVKEADENNNDFYLERSALPSSADEPPAQPMIDVSLWLQVPQSVSAQPVNLSQFFRNLLAFIRLDQRPLTAFAGLPEAFVGVDVRANLLVKNTGTVDANGIRLEFTCPRGSSEQSIMVGGKSAARSAGGAVALGNLAPSASSHVILTCRIGQSAAKTILRWQATARINSVKKPFYSPERLIAIKALPVEKMQTAADAEAPSVDLQMDGVGFDPFVDVIAGDRLPFTARFSGIVKNRGRAPAGPTRARLRVDIAADGQWDIVPGFTDIGPLAPDAYQLTQWTVDWKAPVGRYAFEVCSDAGNAQRETDERNNCALEYFNLIVGQEPSFEEELIDE